METISVFTNLFLALVTGVYVWLTWHMLKANRESTRIMQQQLEATLRPYIVVDVTVHGGLFLLKISNNGATAAENLNLRMSKDFYVCGEPREDLNLAKTPAFTNTIRFFQPKAQLSFELGSVYPKYDTELAPAEFDVTCSYEYGGQKLNEVTRVNLNIFTGTAIPRDLLAEELRKLVKATEEMSGSVKKLRANA